MAVLCEDIELKLATPFIWDGEEIAVWYATYRDGRPFCPLCGVFRRDAGGTPSALLAVAGCTSPLRYHAAKAAEAWPRLLS